MTGLTDIDSGVVMSTHHPAIFLGLFLLFLGFAQSYESHQSPPILKEALPGPFFLARVMVLGGLQGLGLQPIVASFEPLALFFGALGLTAIIDNAALTYLGSLIPTISNEAKYMLVAGAVARGGLTVIANAPYPAGSRCSRAASRTSQPVREDCCLVPPAQLLSPRQHFLLL